MPVFEIDNGGGKTFEVDAPDMATATTAFKSYSGGQSSPEDSGLTADNLARSAAQGIPGIGGVVDKFAAGMDALTQPLLGRGSNAGTLAERYAKNSAQEAAHTQSFETAHPIASTAANIVGGTAATGALMKAIPATASAMGFGGGPLLPNVAKGAASGAAIGGVDAAVRGQDPLSGAEWGGAFGGAAPAAGRMIGSVLGKAMHPVSPAEDVAAAKVAAPLKEAGLTTPEAVQAHLDTIGPEASLVDANPRLTQYGGTIAASPGPGQTVMRDFATGRTTGAGDRILSELDQNMGKPIDLGKASNQIYSEGKAQAGPLFQEAYKTPVQGTPELEAALNTPFGKMALAKAKTLGLSEPNAPPSVMFGQSAAKMPDRMSAAEFRQFSAQPQSTVDVRGLHLTRQALDDMIQPAIRAGQSRKAAVLQGLRSTIDSTLKGVEPMAQADSIYASQAKIRQAMDDGLSIFRNNQAPEDIAAALSKMSEAERQGYLQAGRVAVRNVMGTARNDATAARAMFSKEFNQEKLTQLLGPEGAASILKRIGAENTYAAVNNRIVGNSETASRAMGKADLAEAHGLPSYNDVAVFSGTHGLVRRAIAGALQKAYEAIASGRQKDIELSIAKLLTAQGVDRSAALQRVMKAALSKDKTGQTNRLIAQIVARIPRPSDDQTNPTTPQMQIAQ